MDCSRSFTRGEKTCPAFRAWARRAALCDAPLSPAGRWQPAGGVSAGQLRRRPGPDHGRLSEGPAQGADRGGGGLQRWVPGTGSHILPAVVSPAPPAVSPPRPSASYGGVTAGRAQVWPPLSTGRLVQAEWGRDSVGLAPRVDGRPGGGESELTAPLCPVPALRPGRLASPGLAGDRREAPDEAAQGLAATGPGGRAHDRLHRGDPRPRSAERRGPFVPPSLAKASLSFAAGVASLVATPQAPPGAPPLSWFPHWLPGCAAALSTRPGGAPHLSASPEGSLRATGSTRGGTCRQLVLKPAGLQNHRLTPLSPWPLAVQNQQRRQHCGGHGVPRIPAGPVPGSDAGVRLRGR